MNDKKLSIVPDELISCKIMYIALTATQFFWTGVRNLCDEKMPYCELGQPVEQHDIRCLFSFSQREI